MYCAIIGDIIGSRKIPDRNKAQIMLKKILDEINREYAPYIAAKFIITIGDEFQGLLKNPNMLLEIIDTIKFNFYPYRLRIGVGFGEIYTEIIEDMALGSDGPVYYAARDAVNSLKEAETKYGQPEQDILLYSNNHKEKFALVNVALSLCAYMENGWTGKQREAIAYLYFADKSQR